MDIYTLNCSTVDYWVIKMLGVKLERLTLFLGPIQFQVYTFMRKMSLKVLFSQIRSIYTFRKHVSQEVVFYPFKRKIKSYLGITLLELLIVLTILALLMSIAIPSYNEAKNKSQVAKAIGDIKYLEKKNPALRVETWKVSRFFG